MSSYGNRVVYLIGGAWQCAGTLAFVGALLLPFGFAGTARAHALGAECKIRGERIEVEAYFEDDSPARGARISVLDADGKVVAEGQADNGGRWSFPRPAPGSYQVQIDAGGGHRTVVTLSVPAQSPAAGTEPATVSQGATREEFTSRKWGRILLGVFLIMALSIVGRAWLRSARRAELPTNTNDAIPEPGPDV